MVFANHFANVPTGTRRDGVGRQVGVAGYRIDLAILSEDGTQRDLGIECDGRTYHSAPAARDRDWLRQKVLEGLGWKIHRVWSTAWVRNPEAELSRIEDALLAAWSAPSTTNDASMTALTELVDPIENPTSPPLVTVTAEIPQVRLERYERAELPRPPRWAELRYETTQKLVEMTIIVADVEGQVHKDVIIERIRHCYGLGRVSGGTRDRVEHSIDTAIYEGRVESDGTFIWLREDQLRREPRHRPDGNIEHYPPSELKVIVLVTAKSMFGAPRRDLLIESARKLGFTRTGGRIEEVIDSVIQSLLDEGKLGESFGNIHSTD